MATQSGAVQHPFLSGLPEDQRPAGWEGKVKEVRAWLKRMPHLPEITDEHILLFMHSCYGQLEKTKATIKCYYTVRTRWQELFGRRDPLAPELQKMMDVVNMVAMPTRTPEGYKVLVYRLVEYEPYKLHFTTGIKLFFMFNDVQLSEDGLSPGYVVVLDMAGICWGHLLRVSLPSIRKFMIYIQDAHPARLKGVHVINTVGFMDRILALVKPLMKSELLQLLHLHGPVESLARFFPLSLLSEDYGGDAEPMQRLQDRQRRMIETQYPRWFQAEEALKLDDSKRPSKRQPPPPPQVVQPPPPPPPAEPCQDVETSFRRLSID